MEAENTLWMCQVECVAVDDEASEEYLDGEDGGYATVVGHADSEKDFITRMKEYLYDEMGLEVIHMDEVEQVIRRTHLNVPGQEVRDAIEDAIFETDAPALTPFSVYMIETE